MIAKANLDYGTRDFWAFLMRYTTYFKINLKRQKRQKTSTPRYVTLKRVKRLWLNVKAILAPTKAARARQG